VEQIEDARLEGREAASAPGNLKEDGAGTRGAPAADALSSKRRARRAVGIVVHRA